MLPNKNLNLYLVSDTFNLLPEIDLGSENAERLDSPLCDVTNSTAGLPCLSLAGLLQLILSPSTMFSEERVGEKKSCKSASPSHTQAM